MDSKTIYVSGANLVCQFTSIDSAGAGIDSLTTKFSIFDGTNYWNVGETDFDSASEVLHTADVDAVKSALGLYEYILVGGVALGGKIFRIHVESTQSVTGDIADFAIVNDKVVDTADEIWDEINTGATHNIPTSAGRQLRELASVVIRSNTAQAGSTSNTIKLDTGASATDGAYDPALIAIVGGTGIGQSRNILEYAGATRVAVVDRNWKTTPDNTSDFIIYADAGREHVNEGLAQGGTSVSITLNALASSDDDAYDGQLVFIRSGTGEDQVGLVAAYNGTTKVATIVTAMNGWAVTPDTTSGYVMLPRLMFTLQQIRDTMKLTPTAGAPASGSVDEHLDDIKAKTDLLIGGIKKATAQAKFPLSLVLSSDDVSPGLLKTVTAERALDGTAYTSMTNPVVEIPGGSDGSYTIDLSIADTTSTAKFGFYKFEAPGCRTKKMLIIFAD